ncbi:MAG: hypothetical protein KDH09_10820, partial [Chrysiogenetes bacterium]|nr:hypothetical protein [Chrysiogenetes bacterium]
MILIDAVRDNWVVLLIPVFAGVVGWITNVAAVWLLFHPVEFVGIRPYLGFQGIIPNASKNMGAYLAEIVTEKLLDLRELFAGMEPEKILPTMKPALHAMADEVLEEAAGEHAAQMWGAMDENVKAQ